MTSHYPKTESITRHLTVMNIQKNFLQKYRFWETHVFHWRPQIQMQKIGKLFNSKDELEAWQKNMRNRKRNQGLSKKQ